MSNTLFDKTTGALERGLDFMELRQNVTAANIANAETPDYKAKKVDFEDELSKALQRDGTRNLAAGDARHFPNVQTALDQVDADVYDNPDIPVTNDKNTVDLEKEISTMNENSIRYRAATQLIGKKLGALKYVINGGR